MIINVRCNSDLAESLLNIKKEEIIFLENNFNSKINFQFNNHFSLHDPVIEIENNNNPSSNEEEKIIKIKNKTKEKAAKNTKIKKKIIKTKKTKNKKEVVLDEKKISEVNNPDIGVEEVEEKTGWWS